MSNELDNLVAQIKSYCREHGLNYLVAIEDTNGNLHNGYGFVPGSSIEDLVGKLREIMEQ